VSGIPFARPRVVSTGAELRVINLIRSYSVPWNDVSSLVAVQAHVGRGLPSLTLTGLYLDDPPRLRAVGG
jgi:hypothetical protein